MAVCSHAWPDMARHGHIWPYMAMHGHAWPCMAMHGQTWPYMAIPCMAMHTMEKSENQKAVKMTKNEEKRCFTFFGFLHP